MIRVAAAVAALMLCACTASVEPILKPASELTGTPTPAPGESGEPIFDADDDVLTVAIREPATLDPMLIANPGAVLVARQIFEGLTKWDPVEETVVPAAAEGWTVGNGGHTFIFRLRPGMTFHNGAPVTASDFIYAFDRIAQKASASEIAYTLEPVLGFAEVNGSGRSDHLAGLTAPNDLTLIIELSTPYQDLPAVLTHPGLVPLPVDAVTDYDTFLASPTGNGPFEMATEWFSGAPIELKAFTGSVETPELDGIRFLPYPDAAASWLRFVDGEIDVAEVPQGQIEEAAGTVGERGFESFLSGYYLGFNLDAPEIQQISLRKAINLAIDRDRISRYVFKGNMQAPRGIVPVGMPGFGENLCVGLCEYQPEAAERLVARLPAARRDVFIQYDEGVSHRRAMDMIKRNLEAVGLTVHLTSFEFPQYLRLLRESKQSIYRFGWLAEFPSPDVFLSALFGSESIDNYSNFSSGEVEDLLGQAHAEPSEGRRTQLYIAAEKAILSSVPIVPIGSFLTHWAAQPWVRSIEFDTQGGFDALDIAIDREG